MEVCMKGPVPVESASALIDERIKELGDWRGKTLAKVREIVHEADPEILEEWKWMGTPIWSHGGIVCTGETPAGAERSSAVCGHCVSTTRRAALCASRRTTNNGSD